MTFRSLRYLWPRRLRDGLEGQIGYAGVVLLLQQFKQAPVAQGGELRRVDPQFCAGCIDPIRRSLKFGEQADRGIVDDAMANGVRPLRAPFLIGEGGLESQVLEDGG